MKKENTLWAKLGKKGGKASSENLSPRERSERASLAAKARWNILKMQVSLANKGSAVQMALMYNKSQSIFFEQPMTDLMLTIMKGEPKKFFYYELDKKNNGIRINGEAPWQDW